MHGERLSVHLNADRPKEVESRLTGVPLLPVEERQVPQSDIPGEQSWPTQPFSTISLVPEKISSDVLATMIWRTAS